MENKNRINLYVCILAIGFIYGNLVFSGQVSADEKQVNLPRSPGNIVAATPISIPRPIRLMKITRVQSLTMEKQQKNPLQAIATIHPAQIDGCRVQSVIGNKMVLDISYTVSTALKGPVFCGAFIYEARQQAVNAGYKPVQLQQLPTGSTGLTMVLPKTPFSSAYIETFLIRSGKIITKTQFDLPFEWYGANGKLLTSVKQGAAHSDSDIQTTDTELSFCEKYARAAVAQYELGVKHQLPGIFAPSWSNDEKGHYNWCMKSPGDFAINEDRLRQTHLRKYLPADPGSPSGRIVIPGLNPGRGP